MVPLKEIEYGFGYIIRRSSYTLCSIYLRVALCDDECHAEFYPKYFSCARALRQE